VDIHHAQLVNHACTNAPVRRALSGS
jgi:hypothetical protein